MRGLIWLDIIAHSQPDHKLKWPSMLPLAALAIVELLGSDSLNAAQITGTRGLAGICVSSAIGPVDINSSTRRDLVWGASLGINNICAFGTGHPRNGWRQRCLARRASMLLPGAVARIIAVLILVCDDHGGKRRCIADRRRNRIVQT